MFSHPESLRRPLTVFTLLLTVALLPPAKARAATSEVAEMESYTLTMDKVHDLALALADLSSYTKSHPEVRAKLETAGEEGESLDAAARRMASVPEVVNILSHDRLVPRDFLLAEVTLAQSAMAVASKPIDQGDTEYAAHLHLNPANLTFIRNHQAELKAMQANLGAAS